MRENHLETERFPVASFRADSLIAAPGRLAPGETAVLTLAGELSLHGVTQPLLTPVSVTLSADGAALAVRAEFTVKLADFAIPRPKFLVMKLDELQRITVRLSAQRAGAGG
ncbi:YceI family protein [bacterium]|nr:YceI family protein [bacterium]